MQNPSYFSGVQSRHVQGLVVGLLAAFALTVLCYWPSLSGPFVFDDIPNLEPIGARGGLVSAEHYLEYIFTPQAGPLGRPLSLASFALNAETWPTDPRPFRVTSLILHLVNGVLLFLLARRIFSISKDQRAADYLALMCVAMWLLHPLLVSTTAYIVQRMTLLCTLFTLAGLLCFMRGRSQLPANPSRGWLWIVAGMGGFGLLAVLSKESGILLPLYALAIELTVYRSVKIGARHRNLLLALLVAPVIACMSYFIVRWESLSYGFQFRPFTMIERLMTEAVVLMDYLRQIVAPELAGLGIIHDDFPISTGLMSPVTTLVSVLVIASLVAFAIAARKKFPLAGLGILWFFAGHSLEAGPVPLELYFEHRNYLPLLGPLLVFATLLHAANPNVRRVLVFGVVLFIAAESFMTWQSATTWGNESKLKRIALLEHPDSLRAQEFYVNGLIRAGQYSEALAARERLHEKFPDNTSVMLSILNLRCLVKDLTKQQFAETLRLISHSNYDTQIANYLPVLASNAATGTCSVFGPDELHAVFDSLLRNPEISAHNKSVGAILYNKGVAYAGSGDLDLALEQLDLSYTANPLIDIPILQTVWLLAANRPADAGRYLARARQHGGETIVRRNFRDSDIEYLQQQIERRLSGR